MADYQRRDEQQSGGSRTTEAMLEPAGNEAATGQSAELNGQVSGGGGADAAQAAEAERVARARVEWEGLLGEKIGGEAFELIREHVSYEALLGYAQQGTQAMAEALADGPISPTKEGALGGALDEQAEADALNKMVAALAPALQDLANSWLESETGQKVFGAISRWVEENPEVVTAIVGAAVIGAAVGAYLSNVDPGEFEKMFNLGEHVRAGGSVDVGPIQNLAIQAATLQVEYESENVKASLTGTYSAEDGSSVTAKVSGSGSVGDAEGEGTAEVTVHETGRTSINVQGNLQSIIGTEPFEAGAGVKHTGGGGEDRETRVEGRISLGEQGQQDRVDGWYEAGSGAFGFNLSRDMLEGMASIRHSVKGDGEGNLSSESGATYRPAEGHELGVSAHESAEGTGHEVRYKGEDVGGSGADVEARAGAGTHEGFNLGVGWDIGRFRNELDLEMSQTSRTLGLTTEGEVADNTTLAGDATYDFDAGRFSEYGLQLGWQDPDAFRSFMLEYRGDWLDDHQAYGHQFNTAMEYSLGNLAGRLRGGVELQGSQVSGGHADALVGYQLKENHAIIGGASYEATLEQGQMQHQMGVRAGYQYKDVAVTIGYQSGRDGGDQVTVGLEIPLRW